MAGGRESAKSTTPSSGHQGRMVDPKYPELTPLLEMVHRRKVERKKVEAEMASSKKRGAERKKPAQDGAPSEEEDNELRTLLESASHRLGSGGGHDVKRNMLALFEASIRVASRRQSRMTDIPHFYLPEKATFADLMKLKSERLQRYESVRSFDIEGISPVTPPTELDAYQIIDITRPSDTDPEKAVSVAQILSRETDNYFCGVRPTPADPTAAGGFFVFSNVILPWFFGKCHQMSCSSRYANIANMQVCLDSISLLVEEILRLNADNCKHITGYMISLLEIGMFLFGEFPRMQGPVDLLQDNFDLEVIIYLTAQVLFDMRNWSYLSKTGFAFYLGMVETSLDVIGHKETFLKGWKQMTAAVAKFEKNGNNLDLLGANGFFSLRKLVGNRLHLLKFDEEYVKRLIIRKRRQHKGRMEALKENSNQVQLKDHEGENQNEEEVEPEIPDDLAWKEAKEEYKYWLSLMVDNRDMLIKVLCELNVDLSDKDQSEGLECAPPKSCPSEPSSPGQEKNLLDGFSRDSTLHSELPHVPKSVNFNEQLGDSISTPECVTPCSSMESDSDKRSLNTKLKESKLNADAKSFTPLACQRPPQPPVSDAAHYYPNSMLSTPGSGLPVGMGFPQSYGSMQVVYNAYNAHPGSLPQGYRQQNLQPYGGAPIFYSAEPGSFPQGYTHPFRPQSLQLYGGALIVDSAEAGSLPQGYMHLPWSLPYGGVPTANSSQPGSFPQGYAHSSWPQQYGR